MKKTIKMIGMACLVGAFAFAGSSCKKEKTEVTSIKVSLPTVEVDNFEGERAYIDFAENVMKWSKDDTVAVYNLNQYDNEEGDAYMRSIRNPYKLVSGANTTAGYFSGDGMGEIMNEGFGNMDFAVESPGYYAFYPYSKVKNHPIGPRNSQTFDVPATQNYTVNSMDPTSLVMATKFNDINAFRFQHIFGFISLNLKGENKAVERIVVTDNEFGLNGNITLDLPYITDGNAALLKNRCQELSNYLVNITTVWDHINRMLHDMNYTVGAGDNTMTLECGGVELNTNEYTKFIMTLRPGALHQGFSVTVYYTDNTSETFNQFNPESDAWAFANVPAVPRAFCVRPGVIHNFNLN